MLIDLRATAAGATVVPTTGRTTEQDPARPRRQRTTTRKDAVISPKTSQAGWESLADELAGKVARDSRPSCLLDMIEDGNALTLEEVGTALGVTRERVRQIEGKAIGKLRQLAEERPDMAQVIRELARDVREGGFEQDRGEVYE
jgi:protein required for attachment to host cells